MAAIPCTFQGVLFFSDMGVGGGPMPGGPYPSHPIAPGGPPPGIWPSPGHPDQGLPPSGVGIWPSPGYPAHPISPGGPPPGIWPSPGHPSQGPGFPTAPIVLPPDLPPTMPDPDNRPIEWQTGWTSTSGWVVVGVPTGPTPTPSAGTPPSP